ncbi:nucleotidyltransferase family protein [Hymenobacter sp. 5516J-16]|uniref:nucleotidyltransferase family protein n=1 Tax=Hymenobacter sp. 5516J-16 TaxID=2932253 RepID=UPI001FD4E599|nr:nucleotidyltransferase family protein [Hymenobacter sp. 5516J-16]UOQ76741.1 nucleotidyltransferase family protein [Hymenobacter sp. 5516J-16]
MPAILLLAAGASTRLGRPKQLLEYQDKTLLRRAAETAVTTAAGAPVVVVTGAQHEALLPQLTGLPVAVARCLAWERGMGASLKFGLAVLRSLCATWTDVIVLLCDQPHVSTALLGQLEQLRTTSGQPIVATEYAGVRGVPVLFGPEAVRWCQHLPDGAGAAQLLRQHPELVAAVPFPAGAVDVDTEAQYAALLAG